MSATRLDPTIWTRPLQALTVACSAVFTIGTALQNFVFVDLHLMETAMMLSGMSAADAATAAPDFLRTFRVVGAIYIVGNAIGLLALTGKTWVFWVSVLVNVTQAAGVFVLPPAVIDAQQQLRGGASYMTTLIVDGGALILALVLLASFVRYRTAWARERVPIGHQALDGPDALRRLRRPPTRAAAGPPPQSARF